MVTNETATWWTFNDNNQIQANQNRTQEPVVHSLVYSHVHTLTLFSSCVYSLFNGVLSLWLIIWTLNNIGVTLLNKAAFHSVKFDYPYFLSAVHMACNSFGARMVFWSLERTKNATTGDSKTGAVEANIVTRLLGAITRQTLDTKGQRLILAFSVIFSLNIAIGNVSLKYVSVNFNQVRVV